MTKHSGSRSTPRISEAVILMAGSGSRLRADGTSLPKPLVPVFGRPLILYALEALARAGIKKVHFVIGFQRDLIKALVRPLIPAELDVCFIENRDWQKQNGISVLAAANHVEPPFLLIMSDHLFDQSILDLLLRTAIPDQVNLAIDRKLDSIFDLTDAMKVRTCGDRIIAMGKDLPSYDAIDILMPPEERIANQEALKLWYLLLDHGYHLAASGSSDATFDRPGGGVPGKVRMYTHLDGDFSMARVAAATLVPPNFCRSPRWRISFKSSFSPRRV